MTQDKTVVCEQLYKDFGTTAVVQDVSFVVSSGHILTLLGPSGCGKTTTLRLIAGLEQLDSGTIQVAGRLVADDAFHLPIEKRRVGMVFQDYAIFPHLNVMDNVTFGLGRGKEARRHVPALLDMVGLNGLAEQMPHELSGGQQQRVALARALAPNPDVLLLDEPFSNLDSSLRAQVRQEVRHILKQNRATAVFVTHDQEEALFLGDYVAVMQKGHIEQIGTPEAVFAKPSTQFVAEFLGAADFILGEVTPRGIQTSLGILPQQLPLVDGTTISVAVRPDDVRLEADAMGNGRVASRQFLGIAYMYDVVLADGTHVHSWQPHTVQFAHDTIVQASLRADHPLACFYDGVLVQA